MNNLKTKLMTFDEWWNKRKYYSLQRFAELWIRKPCEKAWNAAVREMIKQEAK